MNYSSSVSISHYGHRRSGITHREVAENFTVSESGHPDNCPNSNIAFENSKQVEMYSNWGWGLPTLLSPALYTYAADYGGL